jgi:hypothetical protein
MVFVDAAGRATASNSKTLEGERSVARACVSSARTLRPCSEVNSARLNEWRNSSRRSSRRRKTLAKSGCVDGFRPMSSLSACGESGSCWLNAQLSLTYERGSSP